ncbi:MAG: YdiU family protein [Immundisolibacteraceae bacterium]|nr:YdiU family protein [Immundisolibacteraceae bacterium]
MSLTKLNLNNRFTNSFKADTETANRPRQVESAYSWVTPKSFDNPGMVAFSSSTADLLGLDPTPDDSELVQQLAGQQLPPAMQPYSMNYGGHQFGNWAAQLGDGRAINLGEITSDKGDHWALQLKGAGPTPYSRGADGYAVLRSSIREFLCSEAMFHLGVPTTRALSLVTSGEQVVRDMLYDGHPAPEPGAVVCRVAPTFIRFGHFQLPASRQDEALLKQFADFTLTNFFPEFGEPSKTAYGQMFGEVCRLTAEMVVHWERVGFVHGVMNTDNMSILGLTIDYGPYGWLDNYDPEWTPNTTDAQNRRYRFGNQADIALWNLAQLGNALYSLIDDAAPLEAGLESYRRQYQQLSQRMMADKLGLRTVDDNDNELFGELLDLLGAVETDMTLFYRRLADIDIVMLTDEKGQDYQLMERLADCYYTPDEIPEAIVLQTIEWLRRYGQRLVAENADESARRNLMNRTNPKYLPRNYLAQQVIDEAEQGNYAPLQELFEVIRNPYDDQPEFDHYSEKRPDWARQRVGCSMLSCSS